MQRYSRSSNPMRRAVSTFSLTRIPTAGDSSRMWGSPFVPDTGTEVEVVRRRGAAVLGMLAGCRRCRQAPATTTSLVARAVPAAADAMVVDDDPARPEVRPEVLLARPEARLARLVHLEVRPVRLVVRSEVRHDCRPGRYPRVVRSIHCSAAHRVPLRRSKAARPAPRLPEEQPTRWGR
jgi:hypothetical protein